MANDNAARLPIQPASGPGTPNSIPDPDPDDLAAWEAEFRVPSQDIKGHSERQWFRLQPGHARQLSILFESRQYPYRQKADIIRHAVVRHLRWLEANCPSPLPSVMCQVDAIMTIIRDDEFLQELRLVFERATERVSAYLSTGDRPAARRLISDIRSQIDNMPPGEWRDKYQAEIIRRYGHI